MSDNVRLSGICSEVFNEVDRATSLHKPMVNLHEGFAIIHEEFDELKAEVWKNPRKHPERDAKAREEAIQLAAMAVRMVQDLLS